MLNSIHVSKASLTKRFFCTKASHLYYNLIHKTSYCLAKRCLCGSIALMFQ